MYFIEVNCLNEFQNYGWKTDTSIYLVKSWTQLLVHIHNIETGVVKLYP